MSRLSDEFVLKLALEDASFACREAVMSVGWNLDVVELARIVPKIGTGLTRNPSRIEILLSPADETGTTVRLDGSIRGMGPVQKGHLRGEMNRLRNAIEVTAHRAG